MLARDVMQSGVMAVSPELGLKALEEFFITEEISGAPVVAADGTLCGIVSKTDLVRALSDSDLSGGEARLLPALRVEDIMTRDVVVVAPGDDVASVARCMVDGHLHRVLVGTPDEVVGIITTFDLLKLLA